MQHCNHMSITIPCCKMYLAVLPENKDVPFLISSWQSKVLSFPKAKSGLPPVVEVRGGVDRLVYNVSTTTSTGTGRNISYLERAAPWRNKARGWGHHPSTPLSTSFIAPKASAEGACILSKLGDSYEVWLVTVVVVCVVTVMVWVLVYGSYIEVANMGVSGDTFWHIL